MGHEPAICARSARPRGFLPFYSAQILGRTKDAKAGHTIPEHAHDVVPRRGGLLVRDGVGDDVRHGLGVGGVQLADLIIAVRSGLVEKRKERENANGR
jgi:hypothetical protein